MKGYTIPSPQTPPSADHEQSVPSRSAPGSATPGEEALKHKRESAVEEETHEQSGGATETPAEEVVEEVAKVALATTAVVIGVPVLIIAALFTAGFLRRPIERALGRLAIGIQDIHVSSGLPLAVMDILREIRADMDVVSAMKDVRQGSG